jgi:hypothetical protein
LWLPDEVLKDLSAVLSHSPDAPDIRQVLSKVRKHLLGPTNLGPEKFIIFRMMLVTVPTKMTQNKKFFNHSSK